MSLTPANFPIIAGALNERRLGEFARALTRMEGYENEGVLIKAEFADLTYYFNGAFEMAWKNVVREPFLNAGRWESLTPEEAKADAAMNSYPSCYLAAGQLRKMETTKAKMETKSAFLDAIISVLVEAASIGAVMEQLKTKIGKRKPAVTKTSMARDERAAKAMHCQICGGDVLAETGVIAHHGYQRPGEGWQTASCPGARELPYEADRDALGVYIESLKQRKIGTEAGLVAVRAETVDLRWTYNDYSQKRPRWERQPEVSVTVNRANFEERLAEAVTRGSGKGVTFDQLKSGKIIELTTLIGSLHRAIVQQTKRYNDWVKTHKWRGDAWVGVVYKAQGGTYEQMIEGKSPPIVFTEVEDDDWQFS